MKKKYLNKKNNITPGTLDGTGVTRWEWLSSLFFCLGTIAPFGTNPPCQNYVGVKCKSKSSISVCWLVGWLVGWCYFLVLYLFVVVPEIIQL